MSGSVLQRIVRRPVWQKLISGCLLLVMPGVLSAQNTAAAGDLSAGHGLI